MNNIKLTVVITITLIILLITPKIIKQKTYKKLTSLLSNKQYDQFEKKLDSLSAITSFKPFNREYMRLTSYFMQNNQSKIKNQLDLMFDKLKMTKEQKKAVATRGFYFYMEIQEYDKANKMISILQDTPINQNEMHNIKVMYSILAEKKGDYIEEIKNRLKALKKDISSYSDNAKQVKIGIFEYLLGLQYYYINEKQISHKYLISALYHCKNTPYEREIKKYL